MDKKTGVDHDIDQSLYVEYLLDLVTPRQRELAYLIMGGCTVTEAGRELGISRQAAQSLFSRLRSALTKHVDKSPKG